MASLFDIIKSESPKMFTSPRELKEFISAHEEELHDYTTYQLNSKLRLEGYRIVTYKDNGVKKYKVKIDYYLPHRKRNPMSAWLRTVKINQISERVNAPVVDLLNEMVALLNDNYASKAQD